MCRGSLAERPVSDALTRELTPACSLRCPPATDATQTHRPAIDDAQIFCTVEAAHMLERSGSLRPSKRIGNSA